MHDLLPDWTAMSAAEKVEAVRPLVAQGLSSAQIAAQFRNISRNSIISLCHRNKMKLQGRSGRADANLAPRRPKAHGNLKQPKVQAIVAKKLRMAKEPAFETAPLPEEELGNDVGHLIGIMDLTNDTCRFMHGDPKGQHGYCGKQTKAGSSWCAHHHAVVFPGGRS